MKGVFLKLAVVACVGLLVTACGGSVESDAQRLANLQCKVQKLLAKAQAKAQSGDMSVMAEATKITAEATALKSELESKYTSDEDKAKLAEAFLKALENCK